VLYNATINNDLTLAPRYIVSNAATDVIYNNTQLNLTLSLTNAAQITSWNPAASLVVILEVY
jgi:hypothetical protein